MNRNKTFKKKKCLKPIEREWEETTDLEKIFAKDTSDKRLLSKIYEELLKQQENKWPDLKTRPKTLTDTSPKKIYRCKISIWKDVPHMSSEKCKLKQ